MKLVVSQEVLFLYGVNLVLPQSRSTDSFELRVTWTVGEVLGSTYIVRITVVIIVDLRHIPRHINHHQIPV